MTALEEAGKESAMPAKCSASNTSKLCPSTAGGSLGHRWVSQMISLHVGKKGVRKEAEYEDSSPSKNLDWFANLQPSPEL